MSELALQALVNDVRNPLKAHECVLLFDSNQSSLPLKIYESAHIHFRNQAYDRLRVISKKLCESVVREHLRGFRKTDNIPECCPACRATISFNQALACLSLPQLIVVLMATHYFSSTQGFRKILKKDPDIKHIYGSLPSALKTRLDDALGIGDEDNIPVCSCIVM